MKRSIAFVLTLAALAFTACDKQSGMEVRTYELQKMSFDDAASLITPYVREGGLVTGHATGRTLTVRETPERLEEIEATLARFDGPSSTVLLRFQIIEADGFTGRDSAIADVEASLRGLFRYRGYRLAREVLVSVAEGETFDQGQGIEFYVRGHVRHLRDAGEGKAVPVHVEMLFNGREIESTINAIVGETVVIGSSNASSGDGALILAVRAELPKG